MKMLWLTAILLTAMSTMTFANEGDNHVPIDHITKWKGDPYQGSINLTLNHEHGMISARIETDDLLLVSLTSDQLDNYVSLFTDPKTMALYTNGQPWTQEHVEAAVHKWVMRWEKDQDPYSAFAIFEKKKNHFIGHIVLGHGSRYAQAELAFLFTAAFRKVNYATQAVTAILNGYVPRLMQDQYPVNLNSSVIDASYLRSIHATSQYNDTFTGQAMIRSGMSIAEDDILWGAQRFDYLIRVDQILHSVIFPDEELFNSGD